MRKTASLIVLAAALLTGCADRSLPTAIGDPLLALDQAPGCELGLSDSEAIAGIDALLAEVDALEAAGALNAGQARAVRNHLTHARRQIERGMYCPARAMLRAARNQLEGWVEAGVVDEEDAAPILEDLDHLLGEGPAIVAATLSAGGMHTCGLTWGGRAYCWGGNGFGEIGDGTTERRAVPTPVATSLRFESIATGREFTCAVSRGGGTYCWGRNHRGQLGDGTLSDRTAPVRVVSSASFESVVAGTAHVCALDGNREAHCWGAGSNGQLGRGTSGLDHIENPTPAPVLGDHRWQMISLGTDYTCGLLDSGEAYCWGTGSTGATGQGEPGLGRAVPAPVVTELTFGHIAARDFHTCALTAGEGAAYCWGGNFLGELGDGTGIGRSFTPVAVATPLRFASIVTGASTSCALTAEGAAHCWGHNEDGRLGDGTTESRATPVPVAGALAFRELSGGGAHNCGITIDGDPYCWGRNTDGQVGDGTFDNRMAPTPVLGWGDLP
jgi:alpha-tubulin suppressor-like RCC1 family protein